MRANIREDIIRSIGSGQIEIGRIPKGVPIDRLRCDGEKLVDLDDYSSIWVRHIGGRFELHAIQVPGPLSVLKIRLARDWHSPFEQCRGKDSVGDYLTVNGLTQLLDANESTVYRFIYRGIIPPEFVLHDSKSGVYLIQNNDQLIGLLRQRVEKNKHRNGMLKTQKTA